MWNEAALGSRIIIPDIVNSEIRRSLLKNELSASLVRLDRLNGNPCANLPITTPAIERAADLWAQARRKGESTSPEKSIDGDVILAAEALEYCSDADDWWVATENRRHLSRYLGDRAQPWRRIAAFRP